jgi:precorrin-2 dehydrogenase / sirohydrochlorin ferrochelatase
MENYYAMMIDLTSKQCLVVGGGSVGERKVASLLKAGANVILVSPTASLQLKRWAVSSRIKWLKRVYRSSDGEKCLIVIAATNSAVINKKVYQDATKRDQWINVVDQPQLCNFIVPSTIKQGKLQIAISTSGASPTLTKKIRQELEQQFGSEYELYLNLVQEIRKMLQHHVPDEAKRATLIRALATENWLEHCRDQPDLVKEMMLQWIDQKIAESSKKVTLSTD